MEGLRLAHIGIVVRDISKFGTILREVLGAVPLTEIIEDPGQKALLQMFRSGSYCLELIAPSCAESSVHTALKHQGESLLHMCFETDDLDDTLRRVRKQGVLIFRSPTPGRLFGGKRVAFGMLPNRMVVEFVESGWLEAMKDNRIGPDQTDAGL